jgi:hypothetical protein
MIGLAIGANISPPGVELAQLNAMQVRVGTYPPDDTMPGDVHWESCPVVWETHIGAFKYGINETRYEFYS